MEGEAEKKSRVGWRPGTDIAKDPQGEKWAVVSGGIKVKTWMVGTGRRREAPARGHEGGSRSPGQMETWTCPL